MRSTLLCIFLCLVFVVTNSQTIELNKSFGDNGLYIKSPTTRENAGFDVGEAIIELADGKLLAAVNNEKTFLLRYNQDGTIDKTFGADGMSAAFSFRNIVMEKADNGKIIFAGTQYESPQSIIVSQLLSDGQTDTSFGANGKVEFPVGLSTRQLIDVSLQPDGKILLLTSGSYYNNADNTQLIRINPDGTTDLSFGNNGMNNVNWPGAERIWGLETSASGIFIGLSLGIKAAVIAYDLNGIIKSDFGRNGIARLELTVLNAGSMTIQSDGKILVGDASVGDTNPEYGFTVHRLLPNGTNDSTFNGTGRSRTITGYDYITQKKMLTDKDGNIYSIGRQSGVSASLAIVRLKSDGTPDALFGNKGTATLATNMLSFEVFDAKLLSNGGIGIIGYIANFPPDYYFIGKLTKDGQPDESFQKNGYLKSFIPKINSYVSDLKFASAGRLYARYGSYDSVSTNGFISIRPDGTTDSNFSSNGFLLSTAYLYDTTTNGVLITAENDDSNGYENRQLLITRYLLNGKPDPNFGYNGRKQIKLLRSFSIWKFLVLPDQQMLVYGSYDELNGQQQFCLARLTKNGDLDLQFGINGYVYFKDDRKLIPGTISLQSDGKIILAGHVYTNNTTTIISACWRVHENGTPDETFGDMGYISEYLGPFSNMYKTYSLSTGHIIAEVLYTLADTGYEIALIKYDSHGKRQSNFGVNGMLTLPIGRLQVLEDGRILNIDEMEEGQQNTMRLIMRKPDGALDENFGPQGVKMISLQQPVRYWTEITQHNNQLYVSGSTKSEFEQKAVIASLSIVPNTTAIASFTLLNSKTDTDIQPLENGNIINIAAIPGKSINIRANTATATKSVVMNLSGTQTRTQTENIAPYALFGNTGNNYWNWKPQAGNYTLSATPYSKTKGQGEAGAAHTVSFTIIHHLTLSSFTLVHSRTNKDITPLLDGAVIDLANTPHINIKANTGIGITESVQFMVNGKKWGKAQNHAPYAIASDNSGNYLDWNIKPGTYTITAVPYSEDFAKNEAGTPLSITVTIINSKQQPLRLAHSSEEQEKLKETKALHLTTYPNPAIHNAVAEFSVSRTTEVTLMIADASGKLVQQVYKGTADSGMVHRKTISTSMWAPGLYFCYLITKEGETIVSKIIKQ